MRAQAEAARKVVAASLLARARMEAKPGGGSAGTRAAPTPAAPPAAPSATPPAGLTGEAEAMLRAREEARARAAGRARSARVPADTAAVGPGSGDGSSDDMAARAARRRQYSLRNPGDGGAGSSFEVNIGGGGADGGQRDEVAELRARLLGEQVEAEASSGLASGVAGATDLTGVIGIPGAPVQPGSRNDSEPTDPATGPNPPDDPQLEALEVALAGEPRDTQWGTATGHLISSALALLPLPGTETVALDCGQTLCRLELAHQDARALAESQSLSSEFLPRNTRNLSWTFGDEERGLRTLYYVVRPGAPLPSPVGGSAP